jgi:hypothetical protein
MSNWEQTGHGAVQISVEDAAKWDENFYTPRVGGRRLVDDLQKPGHLTNGTRLHYAGGLFIGSYRGLHLVSHGGAWIGYRAEFDRYPTLHTSIVVFCNSDAASPGTLARRVADIVLKPDLAPASVTHANSARSTVALHNLTGSYFDEAGAEVFHVLAQGTRVALEAGGSEYPLTPAGGTSFRLGSTLVQFVLDKNGTATALRVNPGEEDAAYARKFAPAVPSAAQLRGVSGRYYSPELDVTWRLRVDDRTVALEPVRYLPQGAAGKLHPQLPDTFTSDGGFLIRFTRDSAGSVTGFSLSAGRGLRALVFTRER